MTASKSHIEDMQARLEQISKREQQLIRTLDEALAEADRKLLDEVRSVALEHETRRTVILTELHSLAARIGAFPVSEVPVGQIEYEHLDLSAYGTEADKTADTHLAKAANVDEPKGADWRKAAENIPDDFELEAEAETNEQAPPEKAKRRA